METTKNASEGTNRKGRKITIKLMLCSTWKYCIKKGVLKKVLMFHSERKRDVSRITPSSVAKDAVDKSKR